jgi:hypothetical protein
MDQGVTRQEHDVRMFIRGRDQKCDVLVQQDIIISSQVTERRETAISSIHLDLFP